MVANSLIIPDFGEMRDDYYYSFAMATAKPAPVCGLAAAFGEVRVVGTSLILI